MTMPTAFTVSMLAWGAIAFPQGYLKSGKMPELLQTTRWGSDYLLKTFRQNDVTPSGKGYLIAYQASPH